MPFSPHPKWILAKLVCSTCELKQQENCWLSQVFTQSYDNRSDDTIVKGSDGTCSQVLSQHTLYMYTYKFYIYSLYTHTHTHICTHICPKIYILLHTISDPTHI